MFLARELLHALESAGCGIIESDRRAPDALSVATEWFTDLVRDDRARCADHDKSCDRDHHPDAVCNPETADAGRDARPVEVYASEHLGISLPSKRRIRAEFNANLMAEAVERMCYAAGWAHLVRSAEVLRVGVGGTTLVAVYLRDGREMLVSVTESGVTGGSQKTGTCSAVHPDFGNRCGRLRGHGGRHVGDGEAWPDVDPVLEQLLREEEEIERRVGRAYWCEGCGHSGFAIKMCPRCGGTDTCLPISVSEENIPRVPTHSTDLDEARFYFSRAVDHATPAERGELLLELYRDGEPLDPPLKGNLVETKIYLAQVLRGLAELAEREGIDIQRVLEDEVDEIAAEIIGSHLRGER